MSITITLETGGLNINVTWETGFSKVIDVPEDVNLWTIGDINNDGVKELFLYTYKDDISAPTTVYVYSIRDGTLLTTFEKPSGRYVGIRGFVDYDDDGVKEIVVVPYYTDRVYLLDVDENFNVQNIEEIYLDGYYGIVHPNLILPERKEMFACGCSRRFVFKVDFERREVSWKKYYGFPYVQSAYDYDRDGIYEIETLWITYHNGYSGNGTTDSDLYVLILDENGNEEHKFMLGDGIDGLSVVALIDEHFVVFEGHFYSLGSDYSGPPKVWLFNEDGELLDVYTSPYPEDNCVYRYPYRVDVDGDGEYEIAVGVLIGYTCCADHIDHIDIYDFEGEKIELVKSVNMKIQSEFDDEEIQIDALTNRKVKYFHEITDEGIWNVYDKDAETLLKSVDLTEYGFEPEDDILTYYTDGVLIAWDRDKGRMVFIRE